MTEQDLRSAIVAEARSWANPRTPFHHQARVKGPGGGVDCLQLVRAVGEATGALPPITLAEEQRFRRYYGRRPNPPKMRACLETFLIEIEADDVLPGDVCWTHWGNDYPIHMAIFADRGGVPYVIHSVWQWGVAEQIVSPEFRERITAFWRYPGLAGVLPKRAR